jgi:hypothetical protein
MYKIDFDNFYSTKITRVANTLPEEKMLFVATRLGVTVA